MSINSLKTLYTTFQDGLSQSIIDTTRDLSNCTTLKDIKSQLSIICSLYTDLDYINKVINQLSITDSEAENVEN